MIRDGDGVHFFDVELGRFIRSVDNRSEIFSLGSGRVAQFSGGTGTVYSTRSMRAEREFSVGVRVDRLGTGDGVFAVAGPRIADDYERAETVRVEVYESGTYRLLYAIEAPFATEYVPQAVYNADVRDVAVSPDGEHVALVTSWRDGFGRERVFTKETRVLDSSGRVVSRLRYNNREVSRAEFVATSSNEVVVRFGGFRRRYDWRTGEYLGFEGYTSGTTRRLSSGETLVWSSGHIEVGDEMVFSSDFIEDVAVDERRNLLAAYTRGNQLLLYRLRSLEPVARSVRSEEAWLTWTPEGFFTGPDSSAKRLAYLVASDYTIYDMDQFFDLFFRPDVVAERIAGRDITRAVGDLTIESVLAPVPEVRLEADEPQAGLVRVRVIATDRGGGAGDIRLFHNGVRVATATRGLAATGTGATTGAEFALQLADGRNEIRAVAHTSRGVAGEPALLELSYDAPVRQKPALFLLAVGINQYRNPRYNLNYAVGDAEGFVRAMESAGEDLYSRIYTTVVRDRDASRETIVAAIREISEQASPDDVFLFFYAGHGIALDLEEDGSSEFYFIPSDVTQMTDPGQVRRAGLSGPEFQELASAVPARKQFFVLDACNSGAIGAAFGIRGAAEELALSRLSRATGSALIAASRDDQFAQEFDALGQGALTRAVIDGLAGEAASGRDQITVSGLKSYVEFTLPDLTERYAGRPQFPTGFVFGQDFPIGLR